MQISNQQIPTIYYYPPYQTNNLINTHLNQSHSNNVHIYHRIQSSISQKHSQLHKVNPQHQNIKNKNNLNDKQTQHHFNKNQLSKTQTYTAQSPAPRQIYYDTQNIQNCSINANKNLTNMLSDSVIRNKSVFQLKRKQSSNTNSKDVRQEYYKGQQQRQELMNKLPQIQLQQLNKNYIPRQNQGNSSKSPISKQLKKNTSPSHFPHTQHSQHSQHSHHSSHSSHSPFKFRSSSIKQHNLIQGLNLKKTQSNIQHQKQQIKKNKEFLSYKSIPITKRDNQQNDINNYKTGLCTDRNNSSVSVCSTTYGNSNTNSICLDQVPKIQPLKIGAHVKNSYQIFSKKQSGKEVQCQTNPIDIESNVQVSKLKDNVKVLENQIEELKITVHQKDMKIRQIQHEMNLQKIAAQKKVLITERELTSKKQTQISLLKQQYQKQISKIVSQLKEKFSVEQKQTQFRLQNSINQLRKQNQDIKFQCQSYQAQKNQLLANIQNQQKIIIGNQHRMRDLQRIKSIYEEKNIKLQEHCQKQNQQIQFLLSSKISSSPQPASQKHDRSINVDMKSQIQSQQAQKIKQLEQKIIQYLSNIDKQSQQLKQSKSQLQKYKRRSQQFNFVIIDKQSLIKSLYKDLKAIQKQLIDSKKINQKLSDMLNQQNYQIGKLNAKLLNLKYSNVILEECL